METLTGNPVAQIANVHTTFNIVTTLILLPFGGLHIGSRPAAPGYKASEPQKEVSNTLRLLKAIIPWDMPPLSSPSLSNEVSRMSGMATM